LLPLSRLGRSTLRLDLLEILKMGFSTTGGRRVDRIRYKRLDDKVMVRIKASCGSCRNIEVQKQCVIIQQKMKIYVKT